MVLVAEVAVWLLSPRDEPPDPVPVARADYFSAGASSSARDDFRDGQRWLAIAGLAIEGAVLLGARARAPARRCAGGSSGSRRARCSAPPPPAPRSSLLTARGAAARSASSPTSARSTSGSRPSRSARGCGTWRARPAITACSPPAGAALLLRARAPPAARAGGSRARRSSTGLAVVFVWIAPVRPRADLQQASSRCPDRAGRGRTCSRSASGPGSRSARSTGSTPAAG